MKFGLIGHPIGHSLSPALFKAGYDGRYPYELIEGEDFERSYHRFLDGYDGINVTAPFKEAACAKADILSEECRLTGAANLLVRTSEGVKAYNSDYRGLLLWIGERLASQEGCALIVGCGGAGKAAAAAAASTGLYCILMNRNMARAEALSENLNAQGFHTETRPLDDFRECFRKADVVIYNVPAPISQLETLQDEDFAKGHPKHILEANYKDPSFDKGLITRMQRVNPQATYTAGRTWLLLQALTGYEIFTGEKPDLVKMTDVL